MMMMMVVVVVMMIPTIINLKDPQYRGTSIYKLRLYHKTCTPVTALLITQTNNKKLHQTFQWH
jgi:hypothetical protein